MQQAVEAENKAKQNELVQTKLKALSSKSTAQVNVKKSNEVTRFTQNDFEDSSDYDYKDRFQEKNQKVFIFNNVA